MAGLFLQDNNPVAIRFGAQEVTTIYVGHLKMWPVAEIESAAMPFYLVGRPADLIRDLFMRTHSKNFALGGNTVNLVNGAYIECLTTDFALDGQAVRVRRGVTAKLDAVSFALDGIEVNSRRSLILHVGHGEVVLSGNVSRLIRAKRMSASATAFVLTGYAVGWLEDEVIVASTGVFIQLRPPAKFKRSLIMPTAYGGFAVAGNAVSLVQRRMVADSATFEMAGVDVVMNAGIRILVEPGTFGIGGGDMSVARALIARADTGSLTLDGTATGMLRGYIVRAEIGSLVLTGGTIELYTYDLRMLAGDETGNFRSLAGDESGNRRRI